MKKVLAILVAVGVTACGQVEQSAPVPVVQRPPAKAHNYDLKDGTEYGYAVAISQAQQQAGQVSNQVLMFRYLGEHEGRHQLHQTDGNVVAVMECTNPCEFIKIMSFVDAPYMRDSITVERIQNVPGSIANLAFDDALNGRLEVSTRNRDGKATRVWMHERRGLGPLAEAQ